MEVEEVQGEYTLQNLEERIGYQFQDINLLRQALTHSSFTNERKINKTENYERVSGGCGAGAGVQRISL